MDDLFKKNGDLLDLKGHVNLDVAWNDPLAETGIVLCAGNATINSCTYVGGRVS